MTTTPTRQNVFDALLAERIGRLSETVRVSVEGCLDIAALDEMDATGKDYGECYDEMVEHYEAGQEVLRDWRLVQSETFDWDAASVSRCLEHLEEVESHAPVGYILATYGGYIPTKQHTRYVGLAPRQEQES